jgi:hypothetical protein
MTRLIIGERVGRHFQLVGISFEAEIDAGGLVTSEETTDLGTLPWKKPRYWK